MMSLKPFVFLTIFQILSSEIQAQFITQGSDINLGRIIDNGQLGSLC